MSLSILVQVSAPVDSMNERTGAVSLPTILEALVEDLQVSVTSSYNMENALNKITIPLASIERMHGALRLSRFILVKKLDDLKRTLQVVHTFVVDVTYLLEDLCEQGCAECEIDMEHVNAGYEGAMDATEDLHREVVALRADFTRVERALIIIFSAQHPTALLRNRPDRSPRWWRDDSENPLQAEAFGNPDGRQALSAFVSALEHILLDFSVLKEWMVHQRFSMKQALQDKQRGETMEPGDCRSQIAQWKDYRIGVLGAVQEVAMLADIASVAPLSTERLPRNRSQPPNSLSTLHTHAPIPRPPQPAAGAQVHSCSQTPSDTWEAPRARSAPPRCPAPAAPDDPPP